MTVMWSEWELEAEAAPQFQWMRPPSKIGGRPLVPIGGQGRAEIKPHTETGIRGGLVQLRRHPASRPRVLLTYLAVGGNDAPVQSGSAHRIRVFATRFVDVTPALLVDSHAWWDLGSFPAPRYVPLRLDNPGLFGSAVERFVRRHFDEKVLKLSNRKIRAATGGARTGADVRWDELADFYRELAAELRDPFFADLAAELEAPGELTV